MIYKIGFTSAVVLAVMGSGLSQEPIPQDRLRSLVTVLVRETQNLTDLPLATDADPEKAFGIRSNTNAAVVVPNKGFSDDVFLKADLSVAPIGQLWLSQISPTVNGVVASKSHLRLVNVAVQNDIANLPLFLLGVRKKNGQLELVVFAKEKSPLVTLPLRKVNVQQGSPIELSGRRQDEGTGILTLRFLGKYVAELEVGAAG